MRGAWGISVGSLGLGNLVAMDRFSGADRGLFVREFYKNGNSATVARRKFCSIRLIRHLNDAPSTRLIAKWVKKFEETRSTLEKPIWAAKNIKNSRKRGQCYGRIIGPFLKMEGDAHSQ